MTLKPRPMATRTCRHCGRDFLRQRKIRVGKLGSHYCSPKCWYDWQNKHSKKRRTCPQCSKEFVCSYALQKTCSRRCNSLMRGARTVNCEICGKAVYRNPGAARSARFCSLQCHNKDQKIDSISEITCTNCGKAFQRRTAQRRRKRAFCSRECQHKHNRGANNPTWRGQRRHERGTTWRDNAKTARERDGHKCQSCGMESRRGQRVSVDHIIAYRLAVGYSAENGVDPNHLTNLISLCRGCHTRKTLRAEAKLLRGDVLGFIADAKAIIPLEKLMAALTLWELA